MLHNPVVNRCCYYPLLIDEAVVTELFSALPESIQLGGDKTGSRIQVINSSTTFPPGDHGDTAQMQVTSMQH